MTSALLGLAVILLIAVVTTALGALTRVLAARLLGPSTPEHRDLTVADRLLLGDERIVRDLQPDSLHPVARTAAHETGAELAHELLHRPEVALRHPAGPAGALRPGRVRGSRPSRPRVSAAADGERVSPAARRSGARAAGARPRRAAAPAARALR